MVGVKGSSLMPRKRANRRPIAPSEPEGYQADDPSIHVVRERIQVRQVLRNDAPRAEEDVVRCKVRAVRRVRAQRIDAEDTYTCIDDSLCSLARDARVRRVRVECRPVLGPPRAEEQDLRPTRERGREVRRTVVVDLTAKTAGPTRADRSSSSTHFPPATKCAGASMCVPVCEPSASAETAHPSCSSVRRGVQQNTGSPGYTGVVASSEWERSMICIVVVSSQGVDCILVADRPPLYTSTGTRTRDRISK
jgi:hypothetical protein